MIGDLLGSAIRVVDELRAFANMASLSRIHRVQGYAAGLREAASLASSMLEEAGVEHEVVYIDTPLGLERRWGFWEPRGWRLGHASVEARYPVGWREVASSDYTPLIAAPGTPGGEADGVASTGKAPVRLVDKPSPLHYYAEADDAAAIVFFHAGPGVKYVHLYPPYFGRPRETPAVSLPSSAALNLNGKRVRISIDAGYEPSAPIPVVRAWVGEGPATLLLVAHLCHPRPGSHDNASGVAVAVEAMAAASKIWRGDARLELILAPEWSGIAAACTMGICKPGLVVSALSLDMLGAELSATQSTPRLIRGPAPLLSLMDAPLAHALSLIGEPHLAEGYEPGSDHDVLLSLGIPASLLNEWPDRYYHTSMDTPEKLSPYRMKAVAAAVAAAAAYTSARLGELVKRAAEPPWAEPRESAEKDYDALSREALRLAEARLEAIRRGEEAQPPADPPARRPPLTSLYIYMSGEEDAASQLQQDDKMLSVLNAYAVTAAAAGREAAEAYARARGWELPGWLRSLADRFLAGRLSPR